MCSRPVDWQLKRKSSTQDRVYLSLNGYLLTEIQELYLLDKPIMFCLGCSLDFWQRIIPLCITIYHRYIKNHTLVKVLWDDCIFKKYYVFLKSLSDVLITQGKSKSLLLSLERLIFFIKILRATGSLLLFFFSKKLNFQKSFRIGMLTVALPFSPIRPLF